MENENADSLDDDESEEMLLPPDVMLQALLSDPDVLSAVYQSDRGLFHIYTAEGKIILSESGARLLFNIGARIGHLMELANKSALN